MKHRFSFASVVIAALTPVLSAAVPEWKPAPVSLSTQWAKDVSPTNALVEYPRPQMVREKWVNLNGLWSYGLTDAAVAAPPSEMAGQILVPYPYESSLSGVAQKSIPGQRLWYRRTFTVPGDWAGQNVLLHFGAVNYDSTVSVNGKQVATHRGGYDGFDVDVTSALKAGEDELVVSSWNPVRADNPDAQVLGKQRLRPGGIFYTGATGIWQTVWMEAVPPAHIDSLKMVPDIDAGALAVNATSRGAGEVEITVTDNGSPVGSAKGQANSDIKVAIPNPKLWTPETPHLYDVKVTMGGDTMKSYAGMRKISLGTDEQGRQRILLNNKFYFQVGALDQGYWPDGIYTAPTDEALKFDIVKSKELGWNLLRKHAKVEPARWYYWADKLGMLVWQDMPQMFGGRGDNLSEGAKKQFDVEWERIISEHFNSPSIVVWTTFNEGWGQHDTPEVVARTKKMDPTRLVNNASGWTDEECGDIHDTHAYPGPGAKEPEEKRAAVNGEFGGITVDAGHRWNAAPVMGYGSTLKSSWLATKRFQDLMRRAYEMRDARGTSAFVYTQVTDVEQEINGLMTYDRALVKMDEKIVAAANRGEFLPLPPNPAPEIVPTSDVDPAKWQYTTEKPGEGWFQPKFADAAWKSGNAPFGHDYGHVGTQWRTGDLWIRRTFTMPEKIPAALNLIIRHDEDAEVYINGVLAAKLAGFTRDYQVIPLPAEALKAIKGGENTFAVHVHQTVGGQGIDVGLTEFK